MAAAWSPQSGRWCRPSVQGTGVLASNLAIHLGKIRIQINCPLGLRILKTLQSTEEAYVDKPEAPREHCGEQVPQSERQVRASRQSCRPRAGARPRARELFETIEEESVSGRGWKPHLQGKSYLGCWKGMKGKLTGETVDKLSTHDEQQCEPHGLHVFFIKKSQTLLTGHHRWSNVPALVKTWSCVWSCVLTH